MVKKILLSLALVGALPSTLAFGDEMTTAEAYEDQLDAQQALKFGKHPLGEVDTFARRGNNNDDVGRDIAIGVIGAIVDHIGDRNGRDHRRPPARPGRPGRGDGWDNGWDNGGWGHGRRQIVCYAQNRRGQRFQSVGVIERRVQRRAMNECLDMSRQCRPLGCRVARR